jgi:hypothetical protein
MGYLRLQAWMNYSTTARKLMQRFKITAEGPGQTCGRRFMVEGGRKCILVEENTLTLSAAGRELLRDYRGDHRWTFLSSVVSWLACAGCWP